MTPTSRAEKIASEFNLESVFTGKGFKEFISTLAYEFDECQQKILKSVTMDNPKNRRLVTEAIQKSYAKGFHAAREKAAEIVQEQEAAFKRLAEVGITEGNIVPLAERIRTMEIGE